MSDTTVSPTRSHHNRRQLRERKQKKLYSEEWALADDEYEGGRGFSVAEKLESARFAQAGMVREMKGSDLTVAHLQQYGFNIPLLFKEKTGLGLRVPSPYFSINDVRMCVGSKRVLDVMDVNTQKNLEMTMKEWQQYYEDQEKTRLLNVISLEFSHTKLDHYIQSPDLVRQIDWVDVVWPKQLKEAQVEGTNSLHDMMYPKVQKYCLMSVKNCYTDFHVDFGGTSVWYHILKGSKVFWLIPPTEKNLALYEKWVLSGKQSDIFFGDTVDKCARVYLTAGNTFFIPTGWIHAVYTPTDSLVFGGNFLHSFGIVKQLKIAQVEDSTKVPQKFRYPFFTEMLWYVLAKYVYTLLGRSHLDGDSERVEEIARIPHIHLTHYELFGLKEIVMYLYDLPPNKKNVPDLIKDPVALIKDVRTLVERHCKDSPELAITGRPVLQAERSIAADPPTMPAYDMAVDSSDNSTSTSQQQGDFLPPTATANRVGPRGPYKKQSLSTGAQQRSQGPNNSSSGGGPRRRRTRCKICEACQRSDCGECSFCLDMVKFGGPGRAKQTCMMRQCLQPMLPVTAQCIYCHLDGWRQTPVAPQAKLQASLEGPSSLMECSVCYEITHPDCVQRHAPNISGIVNEDLPNSWECPICCKSGKNTDYKPRHFRARQKSSEIRRMSISSDASSAIEHKPSIETHGDFGGMSSGSDSETPGKSGIRKLGVISPSNSSNTPIKFEIKQENDPSQEHLTGGSVLKRRKSDDGGSMCSSLHESVETVEHSVPRKKSSLRTQLAQQIISSSTKVLKKPMYVVRPAQAGGTTPSPTGHYALDPTCMLAIFRYLPPEALITCSLVCKIWSTVSVDPSLWRRMNCAQYKLSASLLTAIVRRQPEHLILDWTSLAKRQLTWLIARIPGLKNLSLQGTPIQAVVGLYTCLCPPLQILDLSFVRGLNDSAIREILSPPKDSRPGLTDSKSRLRNLKTLKLAGTEISDVALRYITQGLPSLLTLDISSCQRITDAGIFQIGTSSSAINTLVELNLSSCKLVTDLSLDYLEKCEALTRLDLRHVPQVPTQAVIKFAAKSKHNLHVQDVKLVEKRKNVA
ncbi:jmjC domain-containing histone demethylation protein 1 [Lutzomyia longipalpis]|uniref:jmjC domain-containing histone demethylation protein 1 n=1 Tax=Lutzomyia longipalpis TaxID=7200 RepID=UPI0024834600|nr:jmjC domain-containing histone demethylation protein 1 [Lutzomyia longipalpis]